MRLLVIQEKILNSDLFSLFSPGGQITESGAKLEGSPFFCRPCYPNVFNQLDLALLSQVWITRNNTGKKFEDIPIPYSDVKNILEEIHFKDEATRSRCRGWLVLPSRKYLQADILFPGCEFDCRLTIRGRMGMTWIKTR